MMDNWTSASGGSSREKNIFQAQVRSEFSRDNDHRPFCHSSSAKHKQQISRPCTGASISPSQVRPTSIDTHTPSNAELHPLSRAQITAQHDQQHARPHPFPLTGTMHEQPEATALPWPSIARAKAAKCPYTKHAEHEQPFAG